MSHGSAIAHSRRYALRLFPKLVPSRKPLLQSPASRSRGDLGHAHLLQQREIVLDVPIVGDAAVLDLEEVSGDEGDGLAVALDPAEGAGEMAGEAHVHGDVIAGEDHLFYRHREVGNCGAELARGEGWPLRSLRAARRQGTIGEGRRDGLFQEGFVTAVPEFVERARTAFSVPSR